MVIKKDPEDLPEKVVDFNDVYGDINSPQYWIAESEEDLSSSLLVLDGHSTILIYKQETEELPWEAIHEIGQYEYIPDNVGDGLVVFPHTFYMEFSIVLTDKKLDVNANFDGTGVKAITMPFKDVSIEDFMEAFTDRISSLFSSVLKPNDDSLTIEEGEVMTIPDSVQSSLSLKLALMGINLQRVKVDNITEIEVSEGEIHEQVFEVPDKPEEEEEEEKEEEKLVEKEKTPTPPTTSEEKKPTAPPKTPPPTSGSPGSPPSTPGVKATSPPPGPSRQTSSGGPGLPPSTPSSGSSAPSTPPGPKKQSPPPAAPKSKDAVEIEAEKKSPTSIPAPPPGGGGSSSNKESRRRKKKKTSAPTPPPKEEAVKEVAEATPDEDMEMLEGLEEEVEEEDMDDSSPNLYARGMKADDGAKPSLRNVHTTWFDRMIPNRAYPLVIKISTKEMKAGKKVTNVSSGERRSESVDQLVVDDSDLLTIRPEFPGSIVVPAKQQVNVTKDAIARFHVTPLALGSLDSRIVFEQNGEEIHNVHLETKVVKHRVSRWSAALGAISGSLPAVMAFFLDVPPSEFMNARLENISILSGLGYVIPLVLSAIFFGVAGGFYFLQKPSSRDKSISFPR